MSDENEDDDGSSGGEECPDVSDDDEDQDFHGGDDDDLDVLDVGEIQDESGKDRGSGSGRRQDDEQRVVDNIESEGDNNRRQQTRPPPDALRLSPPTFTDAQVYRPPSKYAFPRYNGNGCETPAWSAVRSGFRDRPDDEPISWRQAAGCIENALKRNIFPMEWGRPPSYGTRSISSSTIRNR